MILIESQGPVPPIKIKYMKEEGMKVLARPILVLNCLVFVEFYEKQSNEIDQSNGKEI